MSGDATLRMSWLPAENRRSILRAIPQAADRRTKRRNADRRAASNRRRPGLERGGVPSWPASTRPARAVAVSPNRHSPLGANAFDTPFPGDDGGFEGARWQRWHAFRAGTPGSKEGRRRVCPSFDLPATVLRPGSEHDPQAEAHRSLIRKSAVDVDDLR